MKHLHLTCLCALALAAASCTDDPYPQWIALEQIDTVITPALHGGGGLPSGTCRYRMPRFRREFTADREIESAHAKVCGLGHFEFYVNGDKVGNHFLDPGWTDYGKEALYVDFDITDMLRRGGNTLEVWLGNGFYNVPNDRYVKLAGSYGQPKLRMSIDIRYKGGKHQTIVSDCENWKVCESPITFSSIYGGESYDARRENITEWVTPVEAPIAVRLKPQEGTELAIRCEIPEKSHFQNDEGEWIYDLGQNFSGIVRLGVKGAAGQEVQLWPAELIEDGDIEQEHSGSPYHWDYTLKGSADTEWWQPRFTFYGQRFVKVIGAVPIGEDNPHSLPAITELTGLHTCTAAAQVGSFECGEELFNRTHSLIDWAIRSNTQSVLTDCPHREKLGWLEEAHLMQNSIQYRYDVHALYRKIMDDMESAQWENGCIPTIAPMYVLFEGGFEDTPEWGSAFIICPWQAYLWYGDLSLIKNHYPAMKRYIGYLSGRAENHIVAYGLGDWFDIGPDAPGCSQLTSNGLTATAIYYYDVTLMSKMAELLGFDEDKEQYDSLAEDIGKSFNERFYNETGGYYDRNSQTANAMSLYVGLVPEQNRDRVLRSLIDGISGRDYALTAGDVGYRFVVQTLQSAGRSDVIYRMNCRSDVPGYGWQLEHGATCLTESWQAYTAVSNNHLMLGHLMEWFYGGLCGIGQSEGSVAWEHVLFKPQIVPQVGHAKASLITEKGKIESAWKLDGDFLTVDVAVPEGCDAEVCIPGYGIRERVSAGKHSFTGKESLGKGLVHH